MNYQKLTDKMAKHVAEYYEKHPHPELVYHNLDHTRYVVKAALKIAEYYQLNNEDLFILNAAAWFHDTGYLVNQQDHESSGAKLAEEYLEKNDVDTRVTDKVVATIMATVMPQNPVTLLEQIMCDADLYHLSKKTFMEKSEELRKEMEALNHKEITKELWWPGTIAFMERHHYTSDYGKRVLEPKKAENLALLKAEVETNNHHTDYQQLEKDVEEDEPKKEKKDKKDKKDRPEKGIETMFRITSSNNQRLSDMADKKAHILITVNSIILSAIISLVLRRLDENGYLIMPTFVLLAVSLTSMTFSILATRPTIPHGTFEQRDLDDKTVNLLFFGNFYRMPIEQYKHGMEMVMDDKEFLYGSLIKDVYSQGAVLGRKYFLLRWAYNVFMFGLIVAVIAFIITSVIHTNSTSAN
jgi:predicted metal-dependent HD superfamily phosphohydrolase